MPNYNVIFQHLNKNACTTLNAVVVEAESEQAARDAFHASTWERTEPHILSVYPTDHPAETLRPLRRIGRPRAYAEARRPITLDIPTDLIAAVDERAGSGNRTAWIVDAIRTRLASEQSGE